MAKFEFSTEHYALEWRARSALAGRFSNPAELIAEYLASDAPISDGFRQEFAAALLGQLDGGAGIQFAGTGPLSVIGQIEKRAEWGRLARAYFQSGMTQEKFRYSGLWPLAISQTKLEDALRFYRQFEAWFCEARLTDERLTEAHDFAVSAGRNDLDVQDELYAFMVYCEDSVKALKPAPAT